MRMDQYRGLNEWATKTVLKREKALQRGVNIFPDGRRKHYQRWVKIPVARISHIGTISGAWKPVVAPLRRFQLANGKVYDEYVQQVPWSGGPVYHTALKDVVTGKPVPESLWTEQELMDC